MTTEFLVVTTSRFDRELTKLAARHSTLSESYRQAIAVLKIDPYNRGHQHAIKKLRGVPAGDGQYRIRVARFRFRYDIEGHTVYLKACSLRREDTYR